MPKHPVHRDFYAQARLSDAVKGVDTMIDSPHKCRKYADFRDDNGLAIICMPGGKYNHDLARRYSQDAEMDLLFIRDKCNRDFRIAYFLHHFLDLYNDYQKANHWRVGIGDTRSYARGKMEEIFRNKKSWSTHVSILGVKEEYKAAETFFISPRSQAFLSNLKKRNDLAYV